MEQDEIVSIDEIGEIDTVDVNITGNRLFFADNILTHNSAIDATELHQGHIAGGLTKVNTVDVYATIILSPTMKAAGEIGIQFLKTRNSDGVGKTIYLRWDNKTLRIMNPLKDECDDDGVIMSKVAQSKVTPKTKKSLVDLMDI